MNPLLRPPTLFLALTLCFAPFIHVRAWSLDTISANGANSIPLVSTNRRQWLASVSTAVVGSSLVASPAVAATSYKTYDDPLHGFSIQVPDNWAQTTQQLSDRRKIQVWTDPENDKTLLFVAYTPVRDDFTSLASFGTVDQVAMQSILPKGQMAGEEVKAEMLSALSKNQAYYFDYTQSVPNVQPETHLRAVFALQQGATGGAGAVLVTVTAQTPQERYKDIKAIFDHMIDSYGKSTGTA